MKMLKLLIFSVSVFWLIAPAALGQDMPVERLFNNLRTGQYSGKLIDLDLEKANIDTLIAHLEKVSGISFELSSKISSKALGKRDYSLKQVPWDRILSLILEEFNLEATLKNGAVYIQKKEDSLVRIVREDQYQTPGSPHIPPFFFFLAALVLAGGASGFLLYRIRIKTKASSARELVTDPDKADEIMKKLTYLFDVEKVYRKEDISLQILSEELSIPSYQLSWIINKKMKITFSGLVSSYRVEEVKKRLSSSQEADKTILDIAFDAGFNTKTSFNRVFKKLTRMTPSQYRRRYKVPD